MPKILITILTIFLVAILAASVFFSITPAGRKVINNWKHSLQKADDETLYETRKQVEDTCRAMMSSYNKDKLTYNQYNGNEDPEKQEWADQAKMRANNTASTYNQYILKNNYVWKDNVPDDIEDQLLYLD